MPYERPGDAVRVVAGIDVMSGQIASDDGWAGRVVKTATPAADEPRATRGLVRAGESYNLRPLHVADVLIVSAGSTGIAAWDITGVAKGDLLYITDATNVISTTAGSGKRVLGKVVSLAGEQGAPTNIVRVNLDEKVA